MAGGANTPIEQTQHTNAFSKYKTEILSGLTVALALVPEAVAFAFVAHVHPLVGLYAAFIVGLITAVFGGRPGMISGATGALAVVMVELVMHHGVEYLFPTVILMGLLQIFAGIMRWGKFIRMVPHPVMLGFVNGLAIVIFLAQMTQFKTAAPDGTMVWLGDTKMMYMLGLVALTMGIIWIGPRVIKFIPAPLLAIASVSLLVIGLDIDVPRVGDMASIKGGLPEFMLPAVPMNLETLYIILPYAVILAAVGLIESLLTLNLVADMTETSKAGTSQECLAQGAANVVTGFFGGMGGCAMIGQSMINVKSGGRTRVAGIAASLFLLAFILWASGLIEQIPLAALVGVMFMVVIGTFAWDSLKILHRVPKEDAFVIILVTAVTVYSDLAIAVIVGVIVSALVFAWKAAKRIDVQGHLTDAGHKIYKVQGYLFFASVTDFQDYFTAKDDPDDVVVDFANSRVWDHSALEALDTLAERYQARGKKLHLRHLSADCKKLLHQAGSAVEQVESEDPKYGIAADYAMD
ncbi:MAG: sodium-independent anion transporter [Alphaproteobacteria bacterium]|nr:sodium-independent anion transporter [Alphaproteobacteria bacterium]|tara:strand:- start:17509 stop:19071 length:1563 start_codon:yes stop_codon:yes gene_type:complete